MDNTTQEFSNLLSINSINTYNGGKIVISETKQGIQNEVESILEILPEEPSDDNPDKTIILFRFPDGEKVVQRKFLMHILNKMII